MFLLKGTTQNTFYSLKSNKKSLNFKYICLNRYNNEVNNEGYME